MTLIQLSYLVALDVHRHFRKAAAHCRVAQPSLSAQIRKLEDELGVVLFDRDKKPLAPTSIGEQVIAHARVVLAEVAGLREVVQRTTGALSGELRVGVVPTLASYLLPILLAPIAAAYPEITFVFEELPTQRIIEMIKRDRLDAGLVTMPVAAHGLIEHALFDEPLVGYVSAPHRLAGEKMLQPGIWSLDDLWLLREGDGLSEQTLRLCGVHPAGEAVHRSVRFVGESLETLKRLVEQGAGMTLVPWLAVQAPAPHQQALVKPFARPWPTRTIRCIHARALVKNNLVHAFTSEVLTAVQPFLPGPEKNDGRAAG